MIESSHCVDYGLKTFEKDPAIRTLEDVLYLPRIPGHYDAQYGLYDIYGRMIQSAGPRRGWPNYPLGQTESCCISPSSNHPSAPEPLYFYGGNIVPHYGHFITETLPRYWCGRDVYAGLKILVHAEKTLDSLFALPWLAEIFSFLGLGRDDFVVLERPTRIRMLIVANTAFEENHFAHRAFARFCNELGEKYGEDLAETRPVYLSRANCNSQMRHIEGEQGVVSRLAREGFAIVAPETLRVRQQLRLFSAYRPTLGFVGSAFHNDIFCARPAGIALTCDGLISSNFVLMDRVNDACIRYLTAPGIRLEKFVPGHPALYRLDNPDHVARCLIDLVTQQVWRQEDTNKPTDIDWNHAFRIRTYHGSLVQIDRQTGIVCHGSGEGDRILQLTAYLGNKGWAAFTTSLGDCLSVEKDNNQGAVLYYHFRRFDDGRIAFFSHETRRFLCAVTDSRICCDRIKPSDWECFTLEASTLSHQQKSH